MMRNVVAIQTGIIGWCLTIPIGATAAISRLAFVQVGMIGKGRSEPMKLPFCIPNKIYMWFDPSKLIYGEIPPQGIEIAEYTLNNTGVSKITVSVEEDTPSA